MVVRQHTAPLKINRAKEDPNVSILHVNLKDDMWENAYIQFLVHLIEDGIWIF